MKNIDDNLLFICETKAQVFNAVNIKFNLFTDTNADIYLCDNGVNNLSYLREGLEQCGVFDNTEVYMTGHHTDQSIKGKLYKAINNIKFYKQLEEGLPKLNRRYDIIFIAGPSSSVNSVYYFLKRKIPDLKLYLFEEGIHEYYMLASKSKCFRKIYSLLVYGRYYIDDVEELYVYEPSLVRNKRDDIKVKSIPQVSFKNSVLKDMFNKIFKYNLSIENNSDDKCILFIDQAFPNEKENICQKNILRNIIDKVGHANVLVKMHPHSSDNKYSDLKVKCIGAEQTMEMIELNAMLKNLSLVTICSSSAFNYKLIFNVNMKIILLYKIFEGQTIDEQMYCFMEDFTKKYNDIDIRIPCDIEELLEHISDD